MYTYYGNKVEQILDALDREELKNKSRILQIEIIQKPKNFSEKLEFKIKTDLSDSETVEFSIMDSDTFITNKGDKDDTELVKGKLRLNQKTHTIQFTEDMQKKAFKDIEFSTSECYIKINHAKSGNSFSEVFDVDEYDFRKKEPAPKKENKNVRKFVTEMQPSSKFYLFLKEQETLGYNVKYGLNKEIIKIYPYDDGGKDGVGSATIGYGHLIEKDVPFNPNKPSHSKWKDGITLSKANELLQEDTMKKVEILQKRIKVKLLQREFDALLIAIFNGGFGETLENTINKGVEKLTKEEIFKTFLLRRNKGTIFEDGLTKRRAMEADIFVNDNWQPFPSKKFPDDQSYIKAYKDFLRTGILPILFFFTLLLVSCNPKKTNESLINSKTQLIDKTLNDNVKISDSCSMAIKRIKIIDDGNGSDIEVINNFLIEEDSWKKEIDLIYKKLHKKISKTDKETIFLLEKHHSGWESYMKENYIFRRSFLAHYIYSKQWIFYVFPQMRKEYKNKLLEYYELYEFDKD